MPILNENTDKEWERFGADDPYFGVCANPTYHREFISAAELENFFLSGERYVEAVFARIRANMDDAFAPRNALDFGCGVGRILIPLAKRCERVVGLDISPSYLAEARRNCIQRDLGNVYLIQSDDRLSGLEEQFDLVHSCITLQHINARRGEHLIEQLVQRVAVGGNGVLHLTYNTKDSRLTGVLPRVWRFAKGCYRSLYQRRPPHMQMNAYDLNRVFTLIQKAGVKSVVSDFTDHGGQLGVSLYFRL